MAGIDMEAIFKRMPDRYKMVVAASQRARGLNLGEKPLVEGKIKNNAIIALEEIACGKVRMEVTAKGKDEELKK